MAPDMWTVPRPQFEAKETFETCISKISDAGFKARLVAITDDIVNAEEEYDQKASEALLFEIAAATAVGGVSKDEMVSIYDQRLAAKKGPGRSIYDHIKMLPSGDRCPYCDQRNVSTLDHVLPKTRYPALAVTPINLVGACMECNKAKKTIAPASASEVVLHPYFDDISDQPWLIATVVEQDPCAFVFSVEAHDDWDDDLVERVHGSFQTFGLANLYTSEAARELANIRHNLGSHAANGGVGAVRAELTRQRNSRLAHRRNSWQTAFYTAASSSDWFCSGGFAV